MRKNKSGYCLIFIIFMLPVSAASGQTVAELEKRLAQIQYSYELQDRALDSSRQVLNKHASQIDNEKKKKNPDKEIIVDLMSHSVVISNNIDMQQKKLAQLESEIEAVKRILYRRYSASIDSLNQQKNSRYGGRAPEEIQREILLLTEKKVFAGPRIPGLSLNPDKMLKMDLKNAKTEREQALYREYLQNALNELDVQVKNVNESLRETEEIVYLQKKAGRFLDQAEFQNEIRPGRAGKMAGGNAVTSDMYTGPSPSKDALRFSNISSYTGLLLQLKAVTSPGIKPVWLETGRSGKQLSMSEYTGLLKEVKKNLSEYREILVNKLSGR